MVGNRVGKYVGALGRALGLADGLTLERAVGRLEVTVVGVVLHILTAVDPKLRIVIGIQQHQL